MSNSFDELYDWMYEEVPVPFEIPYLTSFTTVKGARYESGEYPKFMLVGRTVNEWDYNPFEKKVPELESCERTVWNNPKEVWCKLTGADSLKAWENHWYENLVWSNLYKVAPTFGGKVNEELKRSQFRSCYEFLKNEIERFKPHYILFATGYDEWFDAFDGQLGFKCDLCEDYKEQFVEATGRYGETKIVVSKQPELNSKEKYVEAVIKAYKSLED